MFAWIIYLSDCNLHYDQLGDGICNSVLNKEECLHDGNDCINDTYVDGSGSGENPDPDEGSGTSGEITGNNFQILIILSLQSVDHT